jgi:hypothetical protein
MPKHKTKKYPDYRSLTIIDVHGEKKFRIRHRGTNIFFTISEEDIGRYEHLFPQRTDLQKQRFLLLDKIVRVAYDAGHEHGENS